jgi:hypothetical protein
MKYKSRLMSNRANQRQLQKGTSAEPRRINPQSVRSRKMEYRLDCGRDVLVEEIRITPSTLGYLAGSTDAIRAEVIERHPERVREQFPGHGAFLVKPIPEGALPAFIIIVALVSQPVCDPAADFSSLVFSWLSDDLDSSLPELIGREIQGIPWDKLAVDDNF